MKRLEKPNWQKQREQKKLLWLGALGFLILIPLAVGSAYLIKKTLANSDGSYGDTHLSEPEVRGNKIFVRKGQSFQAALDRARPGDTILLQAGETFKGAFKLPAKSGKEFITIRTSAPDAQLPPENRRIDPQKYRSILPKLESDVRGEPVISAFDGVHHFRFIGIEFKPTIEGIGNIIKIGTTKEDKLEDLPHHIEFDRVYLYGSEKYGQRRGIAANGRYIKIKNSYFGEFKRKGDESQAIAAWSTDGHIEIVNNYLEAAAEPVLFGGASGKLGLVPADCLVKDNHMTKPLSWRGTKWVVKNLFEIKNGKRIRVLNNLMTNNWAMAQEGTAVVIKTSGDSGENTEVEDIEFANNIVRSSGSAISIFGGRFKGARRLTIRNNVFEDIDARKYDGRGFFLKTAEWDGLVIENNTVIHTGSIGVAYGKPVTGFIFRNNIVFQNDYGFKGDATGAGRPTLARFYPGGRVSNNIIVGGDRRSYTEENFYPASIRQIGFVNPAANDYRLTQGSPFRTRGFGGKSIGANLDPNDVGGG